jgi:hypothetical protein
MTFLTSKPITSPVPVGAPAPIIPGPGALPEVRESFADHVNGLGKHERYEFLKPILVEAALNGDVSTIETFNPLLDHRDGKILYDVLETAAAKGHAEIVSIILKRHSILLPDLSKAMALVLGNYDKSNPGHRKTFEHLFYPWQGWLSAKVKLREEGCTEILADLLRRVDHVDPNLMQWCLQQFASPKYM